LSAQFAMVISPASVVPSGLGGGQAGSGDAAGLLARAAAGPGFWEDLLGELRRAGLIAELLADGVITAAVAQAQHGHQLDRALTAEVTAMCVIVGALFPDQGYDLVLARTFAMPGLPVKPGAVTPSGPALSKARVLLGEQVMRRTFEIDAARSDAELGITATWHGMEVTGIDGTTIELFSCAELAEAFGVPSGGTKPKLRMAARLSKRVSWRVLFVLKSSSQKSCDGNSPCMYTRPFPPGRKRTRSPSPRRTWITGSWTFDPSRCTARSGEYAAAPAPV